MNVGHVGIVGYIQRMVNITGSLVRPGAELGYELAEGDGTDRIPVVLTHGAGMDRGMYDAQFAALAAAGHRTVRWDLRGHGASRLDAGTRFTAADALDDLAALIDALRLDRPALVGHSLGGNLSQAFVRAHPDRAAGLVVLDSTWNAGPLSAGERFALRLAAPMLGLVPAERLPGLMARASAVTPEAIARTKAMFARMPKAVFLDVWRATVSLVSPEPGFRSLVPLALVRGAEDRTGNIATAMPRWAAAEGVAERVVPRAGHIVTLDAPDAVNELLLQLLAAWHGRPPSAGGTAA
ncbi:alpha/beta hydrolase [Agromyces mediolanus]|uniref:Alpha/beta hydrolase n=2 Tax=Agromyces mediolanus TaxID=41986 RepID=A0A918C876_AGRME|nr:alpha/beta hydrolase [Agromyces mediolanus]GLJ73279.1 alpha/beta hydrolase [Agromyces mediolanus]